MITFFLKINVTVVTWRMTRSIPSQLHLTKARKTCVFLSPPQMASGWCFQLYINFEEFAFRMELRETLIQFYVHCWHTHWKKFRVKNGKQRKVGLIPINFPDQSPTVGKAVVDLSCEVIYISFHARLGAKKWRLSRRIKYWYKNFPTQANLKWLEKAVWSCTGNCFIGYVSANQSELSQWPYSRKQSLLDSSLCTFLHLERMEYTRANIYIPSCSSLHSCLERYVETASKFTYGL